MIDLHSHILPGQDDGAQSLEASLAMARMAVDSGVTSMAATPHCAGDRTREVYAAWQLLKEALEENEIPLKLFLGMEIFGTPETARMLSEKQLFTLNDSRYPLIEFSFRSDGLEETRILHRVCKAGFRPVVAHPERYDYVQHDPAILNLWVQMGCLLQINKGSLLGRFGPVEERLALELVDRGFAFAVASDAHSPHMRTTWMKDVRDLLRQVFSEEAAAALLERNPRKLINNENIHREDPYWFR